MKEITKEDFPFGKVMESMKGAELRQRIQKAQDWPMDKLSLVPYVGVVDEFVEYRYPELTALCPVTGIQDLYEITISFTPDKWIPELKSLKFYFMGYRDLPISHEHLVAKIRKDFKDAVKPSSMSCQLVVTVRGGIYTTIVA